MKKVTTCHCGKPLHYTNTKLEEQVHDLTARLGEYIQVVDGVTRKTYLVQRHYIALHGIKDKELAGLGFEEYVPPKEQTA